MTTFIPLGIALVVSAIGILILIHVLVRLRDRRQARIRLEENLYQSSEYVKVLQEHVRMLEDAAYEEAFQRLMPARSTARSLGLGSVRRPGVQTHVDYVHSTYSGLDTSGSSCDSSSSGGGDFGGGCD